MTSPLFSVALRDLERSDQTRSWDIPAEWLAQTFEGTEATPEGSAGQLELYLKKSAREVLVKGKARAKVIMPCARTLDPLTLELEAEVFLMLTPHATAPAGKRERAPRATENAARSASRGPRSAGSAVRSAEGAVRSAEGAARSAEGAVRSAEGAARSAEGAARGADRAPRTGARAERAPRQRESAADALDAELSSEDAAQDHYEGETVVLDPFVREHLLLELPLFPVRSDLPSEEAGVTGSLPDPAGTDEPVELDPRLAPLAALRQGLAGKK